jgi:hypothetical protein
MLTRSVERSCAFRRYQMTLIPTDMLAIQTATNAYEKKFPRRRSPSAEQALAWQACRSPGWKRLLFWRRMNTVKQIKTAFRVRKATAKWKVTSTAPLDLSAG